MLAKESFQSSHPSGQSAWLPTQLLTMINKGLDALVCVGRDLAPGLSTNFLELAAPSANRLGNVWPYFVPSNGVGSSAQRRGEQARYAERCWTSGWHVGPTRLYYRTIQLNVTRFATLRVRLKPTVGPLKAHQV